MDHDLPPEQALDKIGLCTFFRKGHCPSIIVEQKGLNLSKFLFKLL
jgi:hypothetical protein